MRVARTRAASILAVAATALTGCAAFGGGSDGAGGSDGGGGTNSSSGSTHSATSAKVAQAERTHEYPAPPAPPERTSGAADRAAGAVRAFANGYINWTAATVTRRMQALAAASIGQARSATTLVAAQTENDYELRHGGIANSGVVEAVTPLVDHRDQFVVVTREQTTATNTTAYAGLRPAWHVALATATQIAPGQWVVSRWQPES